MWGQFLFYIWILGTRKTHLEWRNGETIIKKICVVGLGRHKVISSLATFMGKSEVGIDHKNLINFQQNQLHSSWKNNFRTHLTTHTLMNISHDHKPIFSPVCRSRLKVDIPKSSNSAHTFFDWFKSQTLITVNVISSMRHYQHVGIPEQYGKGCNQILDSKLGY
jgi:hypothetical protein